MSNQLHHRRPFVWRRKLSSIVLCTIIAAGAVPAAAALPGTWTFQGPAPELNAQQSLVNLTPAQQPATGSIVSSAASSTNPNLIYVGAAGGGVWKTTDGGDNWTNLTAGLKSFSIGAIGLDPGDATDQTLVVGTGRFGALANNGDDIIGLYFTTDGGTTWTASSSSLLSAAGISGVAVRGTTFLAASNNGLFRSTTGLGGTWSKISAAGVLPNAPARAIFGDPGNPNRLYVTFTGASGGLYRTDDLGNTWTNVTAGIVGISASTIFFNGAVFNDGTNNVVYVMLLGTLGGVADSKIVYRSTDLGATWTALDTPPAGTWKSGTQMNLAVAADKVNPNLVYLTGYAADVYRVDASKARGAQVTNIMQNSATASLNYGAPHPDCTWLSVDASGGLLLTSHGGIYRLASPSSDASATNYWVSKNNNLGVSELHDIAYDHVSHVLVGGLQDNAVAIQSAPGSVIWSRGPGMSGDGGDVGVADIGGGLSIRYGSAQSLGGFARMVYNASNTFVSSSLQSTSVITDSQFVTPITVNTVDPSRLVLGGGKGDLTGRLYESLNQAGTITKVADIGVNAAGAYYSNYKGPIAYGGRRNGVANPDLVYVGWNKTVYSRTTAGGALVPTAALPAGAGTIIQIATNPADWMEVFVADTSHVYRSIDGGLTWSDITGNLFAAGFSSGQITALTYVPGAAGYLTVGTRSGVFASQLSSLGTWDRLGAGLPDVPVWEIVYDRTDDVLAVATLGRGAWLMPNAGGSQLNGAPSVVVTGGPAAAVSECGGDPVLYPCTSHTYTFTVTDPDPGDTFSVVSALVTGGGVLDGPVTTTPTGGSFNVKFIDGPQTPTVTVTVADSYGVTGSGSKTATVTNLAPSVTLTGPSSGSVNTPVTVVASVADAGTPDQAAGFSFAWKVEKYVNNVLVNASFATRNDPNGTASPSTFTYTPDTSGTYKVKVTVFDKDGLGLTPSKSITAASPDVTENDFMVTVNEGQTALNAGVYTHHGPAPLSMSASIGTLLQTQTLFADDFSNDSIGYALGSLSEWNVTAGNVDVLGLPVFNWYPLQGNYVETDGTNGSATLQSKRVFNLVPGTYKLSFKVGHNNDLPNAGNGLHVTLGTAFDESFVTTPTLTPVVRQFTVASSQSASLIFQETGPSDSYGSVIDDVELLRIGTPTIQPGSLNVVGYWQLGENDAGAVAGGPGNSVTLGQDANGLNPALNLTISGSPLYAALDGTPMVIYDSFSGAGAFAGPTVDNILTLTQPMTITKIFNWHQNSSYPGGQDPTTVAGTISILDNPGGASRGNWPAAPSGGILAWEALPNLLLPAGSYKIAESQMGPSSWSYTTTGGNPQWQANKGLCQVTATAGNPGNGSILATAFNGTNQAYTRATPVTTVTNNFGIEAWVRLNSATGAVIAYNGNTSTSGFGIVVAGGHYAALYGSVTVFDSNVPATVGGWHHVALVRDGGISKLYIDGTLANSGNVGAPNTPSGGFAIGRSPEALSNYLNGDVDDVRVFTFAPGSFDPADLGVNTSVAGAWDWSLTTDDGPTENQEVNLVATTGVSGDETQLPFTLVVKNVAPTAVLSNGGAVNEGSAGSVSFTGQTDPSSSDTTAGFHYAYDFNNDGVFDVGNGTYAGSGTSASAVVPALYFTDGPGVRQVRGRILDKDGGFTDYTTSITINDAPPVAGTTGPGTSLEGYTVTIVVGATNPSAADTAAGFTYTIDWGDGSPLQVVTGPSSMTVSHTYTAPGNYTILVTAKDKDNSVSAPTSTPITVNPLTTASLQALISTGAIINLAAADDSALQNMVNAINGLTAPPTPVDITIVLGAGPYNGVTLNPPANVVVALAGNSLPDAPGTQITSTTGSAVTVNGGEVFVQGIDLSTSADAPTVELVTGHLTIRQGKVQESTTADNVALAVSGGNLDYSYDVVTNVNGAGRFWTTYDPEGVRLPDGIDDFLTPNLFSINGVFLDEADPEDAIILSRSAESSAAGQPVTFTATVEVGFVENALATGSVNFYDGNTLLGTVPIAMMGTETFANFTTSSLSVGTHTIIAAFNGDNFYEPTGGVLTHVVGLGPCATNQALCNDNNACTNDVCDMATGLCSNVAAADGSACNDGDACTQTDSCQAGACTGANPVTCVASDECHDVGTCDPATGVCSNPGKADGSACNDGNGCTTGDSCMGAVCVSGSPVTCTALDQCHDVGTCDPATGACSNPNKADGTTCDDTDACTQADSCQAGTCVGANPVVCTAADACHTAGTCDPSTGTCSNPAAPDGTACEDGDLCNGAETCTQGTCASAAPLDCNDNNECTVDSCDKTTGCVHTAGECDAGVGGAGGKGGGVIAQGDGIACTVTLGGRDDSTSGFLTVGGLLAFAGLARRRATRRSKSTR